MTTKVPAELSSTPSITDAGTASIDISGSSDPIFKMQGSGHPQLRLKTTGTTDNTSVDFGDSDSETRGRVLYNHANDYMQFTVAGSTGAQITSGLKFLVNEIGHLTSGTLEIGNGDEKQLFDASGATIQFQTADTERMRIDNNGKILMNHSSAITDETLQVRTNTAIGYGILVDETASAGGTFMRFRVNGNVVGQIYGNGSATTYATSSDATLKDVTGKARGLEVINELNPVSFTWKKTGISDEGFIAQEVDKIIPSVVHKDAEDMYSMDYGRITPILVKAIQEQQEQIESLQQEIEVLKNGN